MRRSSLFSFFFFFNDTATTEIYTLSLHDALPIFRLLGDDHSYGVRYVFGPQHSFSRPGVARIGESCVRGTRRSEEHTSELQSRLHLVCRLLLEKKKTNVIMIVNR